MKVIYSNDGYGIPYGLTVVCPTIHMNNWMDDKPDGLSFYENMWQVDKEGYDKCEVMKLNTSLTVKIIMAKIFFHFLLLAWAGFKRIFRWC